MYILASVFCMFISKSFVVTRWGLVPSFRSWAWPRQSDLTKTMFSAEQSGEYVCLLSSAAAQPLLVVSERSPLGPGLGNLPRGERGRGRGNAIRPGWCGPQAQPRTRPGLIGLPEGEGSALSLTARGVWLVQTPLAHKTEAAGPSAPPPCCGHSILKTEFTGLR